MQGGAYLTMYKWFFNAVTFGKGIMKMYWHKEDRIMPKRIQLPIPKYDNYGRIVGMEMMDKVTQEMQTVYDGPYAEVLHNKLFLPHPEYKDIQKMPQVFITYRKTMDEVHRKAQKGLYKNIDQLGIGAGSGYGSNGIYNGASGDDSREGFLKSLWMEGGHPLEDSQNDFKSPGVDIVEMYGKAILKEEPYEVGSGLQIKGIEEEIVAHVGNYRTLLSLQRNVDGIRPLFDIGCYHHPELYWDLGMVTLTRGIQVQTDNMANLRMHNAMMAVNQMMKVNVNADISPEALVWKPFGLVPVEDMGDIEPLVIPDTAQGLFMEQEAFYKNTIQDITGMYDYNMGQTPTRQERVGVVYGIQAMGEARAKLLLMSMDYLGIQPMLKYMMLLNSYNLPSGYEYRVGDAEQTQFGQIWGDDIHPNYDFKARYTSMEPALGKQARMERLIQLAGMWKDNPWINQYQWNKTLMELSDIREAQYLLKTPQQIQQEQQQQMQQQQMMEAQKQQFETEGKIKTSHKDFIEATALSEQEFGHDLVLEAIKKEAIENKPQ